MPAEASVIVRSKDEAGAIERTLAALRAQSVRAEVIVVDSGSEDGTPEIARRWCDRLIEIPAAEFTYGRALNVGARSASAPIHFALSAHCAPQRGDWIERALELYADDRVAGAYGDLAHPDGRPLGGVFLQDAAHARAHPWWGFSNHASSWRAHVWERFPFDEGLEAAEDKEWALRVLAAGWLVAADPALWVDMSHTWRSGAVALYLRRRREARALASFTTLPAYGLREMLGEWWAAVPPGRSPLRARLNPVRLADLLGRYHGQRMGQAP